MTITVWPSFAIHNLQILCCFLRNFCVAYQDKLLFITEFDGTAGELFLTAATRIAAGEQLCISYIDSTLPGEQRQQQLHWAYGFRCTCERCREEL